MLKSHVWKGLFSEKDHGLMVFCRKQVKNILLILTHHLKGLLQKLIKLMHQQNKGMTVQRVFI